VTGGEELTLPVWPRNKTPKSQIEAFRVPKIQKSRNVKMSDVCWSAFM